jgi:CHAT domain-containing protein/predicted negative regulator of RcsB-dependent stress response
MRRTCCLWVSALVVTVFFFQFCGTCQGVTQDDELRAADEAFNRGDTKQALAVYRRVQRATEVSQPSSPLVAEMINNIAAVDMAEGNMSEFNKHFALAKRVKQELGARVRVEKVTVANNQLLVNGGFEDGLIFPWGTGHYERADGRFGFGVWWNSMNARAFMKIDAAEKNSGQRSLRITNYSPAAPHVFTTLSQRITGLKPNTIYQISYYAKAQDLAPGAMSFAIDAAWVKRLPSLPPGTYGWRAFSSTINIGHNDYIDFRILHQNTGTAWLDDIEIREIEPSEQVNPLQKAERLFDLAEYEEALKACLELEEKYRDNIGTLCQIRLQLGRIYQVLGRYDKALDAFNWATSNGWPRGHIDLARTYFQLGDYQTAKQYFLKSYEVVKGDQGTESLVLHELSRCHMALSQMDKALETQARSYHILKHIEDRHGQALSLNQLGEIHQRLNDHTAARNHFQEALKLARQLADRRLESDILINLATLTYLMKQPDLASQYVDESMRVKEAIHDSLGLVKSFHIQGKLLAARGDLEAARESYRKAVERLEEISNTVSDISRDAKAAFLKQFNQLYREYVEILLKLSQGPRSHSFQEEAFQVVEKARNRVFTEMMEESRALHAFAATSPRQFGELLEQDRLLTLKMHALQRESQMAGDSRDVVRVKAIRERLDKEELQRRSVRAQLEKGYPRYADLKNPKPVNIRDVQQLLGSDEAVVSYFVTPSRTGLWAITREAVEFKVLPLTREEIIQKSERFRHGFSDVASTISRIALTVNDEQFRAAFAKFRCDEGYELYRLLVSPVEHMLHSKMFIFLALDDLLYKLPFETLLTEPFTEDLQGHPIPGDSLAHAPFWVKTHYLSYLPSLSVLRSLRTNKKSKIAKQAPLLAFADPILRWPEAKDAPVGGTSPDTRSSQLRTLQTRSILPETGFAPLPEAREEALQVAKVLGARVERDVYLRDRATESNLKKLPLNGFRNLLFATHGLVAGEFGPGMQPGLVFSLVNDPENDGLLEMGEILGLDFNADLAVLSACNTASGGGEEDRGEGFSGLTRSFMYAGTKSLLVTDWSVESSTARTLVQVTFSKIKEGHAKAKALALAKREVIAGNALITFGHNRLISKAHPFFWAPYVLVGEIR